MAEGLQRYASQQGDFLRELSFTGVPEGVVLTVSHEVGGVQTPTANENGTIAYLLIPGTYSDTVKRDDYRTVHGTVTVEAAAQSVPVSMVAITTWDGTVATGFAGGNAVHRTPPMRSNPATS